MTALLSVSCGGSEEWSKYTFRYRSRTGDSESEMYYDDALFDQESTVYDPSLATASISFAMASFASVDEKDYEKKSLNASDLLESIGFGDIRTNSFFREKPQADSLGCIFGQKEIGGQLMIACGIRGANYEAEWASNFTIGTDETYHQGFLEGSEIFLNSLKDYIAETSVKGEIRLWMVGYSRAGAVCNIAAGIIDEAIHHNTNILGDGVTLTKEGVYAYCFEPPMGVCCDESLYPKSEIFNNIFCIVNHNDIVTKVAMQDFSFTRYGVEKVLFSRLNDPNYDEDIKKVIEYFNSYKNADALGAYTVDGFEMKRSTDNDDQSGDRYLNWTQGLYLDELFSRLTQYGLKDRETYAADIEPGLREILTVIFSNESPVDTLIELGVSVVSELLFTVSFDQLLDKLLHDPTELMDTFETALIHAFEALGIDADSEAVRKTAEGIVTANVRMITHEGDLSLLTPLFDTDNLRRIGQAHQPELTLAYLRALDPKYTDEAVEYDLSGRYYYIEIADTQADVTVLCGGEKVAEFCRGKPVDVGSSVPCARHKKLMICLPYGDTYTVTASTDLVSVSLFDPAQGGHRDCRISAEPADGGFRFTVPAK